MIKNVQIQTIDKCNSKCRMCPSRRIKRTSNEMTIKTFGIILDQLRLGVGNRTVSGNLNIHIYFQNEPLIDFSIFKKADYVKKIFPKSQVIVYTNGINIPFFSRNIIDSNIDIIYYSNYGDNADDFNYITGLKIDDNQIKRIKTYISYISKKKKVIVWDAWETKQGKKSLREFSSRGGFLDNGKIKYKKVTGCNWDRPNWLNFLFNGDMVLCCMDWTGETKYGNIMNKSLKGILSSKERKSLIQAIYGDSQDKSIICYRCEEAQGIKIGQSGEVRPIK